MKQIVRRITWLYALTMHLYPRNFRVQFKEEMTAVFAQAMKEATERGRWAITAVCLREIRDLPGSMLFQHWQAAKERIPMTFLPETNKMQPEPSQPGSWGAALLAGLSHLLAGLLIGLGKLSVFESFATSQTMPILIGVSLAIVVVVLLLVAWRRGWPLWSASWYLYGTWILIAILGLLIENLNLDESWRYTNTMFIGWILFCIGGYFIILTKSRLHGLLSVAFLFPLLGVMMLEFVPNPIEGWLVIGLGVVTALTAGITVRLGSFRKGLVFVLGVNVLAGLTLAYVGEYQIKDLPPYAPPFTPTIGNFLELLTLYVLIALGVITLPFLLRGLWHVGRHKFSS